jgi:hypothetical protein
LLAVAMVASSPFGGIGYMSGLRHIGEPEPSRTGLFSILRRRIAQSGLSDGMGPWPYLWIEGPQDMASLYNDFRHLVSITAVTQPGFVPGLPEADMTLLKQHFVYDPRLPRPPLSRRAGLRLSRTLMTSFCRLVTDEGRLARMTAMYEGLKARRHLFGGHFDFPAQHFESLHRMENAVFVEVGDASGIGAAACGVLFQGILQILHTVTSEHGLRWDASYRLMAGLQDYADEHQVRLLTGGLPDGGSPGLLAFKKRWSNSVAPVYLLKIINDRAAYAALCRDSPERSGYFPLYRAPAAGAPADTGP